MRKGAKRCNRRKGVVTVRKINLPHGHQANSVLLALDAQKHARAAVQVEFLSRRQSANLGGIRQLRIQRKSL